MIVRLERNAVITMWDWGTETSYMHDEIVTDKPYTMLVATADACSASTGRPARVGGKRQP